MRKFKHKITNHIAEEDDRKAGIYNISGMNTHTILPKEWIENSNDWQKISEKDYEILSFRQDVQITDLWLPDRNKGEGYWSRGGYMTNPYTTNQILNHEMYEIYSVKRLSDGEIFTIGDTFKPINSIHHNCNILNDISIKDDNVIFNGYINGLKYWSKVKQPLFTTEDGVDIFEGDEWYWIPTVKADSNYVLHGPTKTINLDYDIRHIVKNFSTKEKAQKYIDLHKPKYSLNDIENCLMSTAITYFQHKVLEDNLKQLNK